MKSIDTGFALKVKTKRRSTYNIHRGTHNVKQLITLPKENEVYKLISFAGGFASINFVLAVAEKENIEELTITSLRVGRKQLQLLDSLYKQGKLNKATFIVGTLMKENAKRYTYYDDLEKISDKNNWEVKAVNNHSKIVLMKTKDNYYVLETSSNFNDNPKIEQFSFENSKELYEFYYNILKEI